MKFWQAIVMGLVQGLTEFLPVSSSGHLILARDIMGISGSYLFFDVMLHVATLVAVCAVLYKEIIALIYPRPSKNLLLLIFASIPAVITGMLAAKFSKGEFFESGKYLCFFFLLTAVVLLLAEIFGKKEFVRGKDAPLELNLRNALFMGLAQSAAVLPGLSRSGSTIAAGVISGGDRERVAKFSFLMSIPIILGSAVFESFGITEMSVGGGELALGMVFAAISGFVAVKIMLKAVAKCNYKWFSLYLAALSVITFINYYSSIKIW